MNIESPQEFHLVVDNDGQTAVELLAVASGLSKQKVKRTMKLGAVWLSSNINPSKPRRIRRASQALKLGEQVHCYYNEAVLSAVALEPSLISDENDYSVWDKPCGLFSQGSKWGDHCTISRTVETYFANKRAVFTVHRLDRATRGLIVVAHSKRAVSELTKLFHDRKITKKYQATVHGDYTSRPQPDTVRTDIDDKAACSHFSCLEYDAKLNRSLIDVQIETGRKHQIRKHLSSIGFPIVGDRLYGTQATEEDLHLTAYFLSFKCPITGEHKQFSLV